MQAFGQPARACVWAGTLLAGSAAAFVGDAARAPLQDKQAGLGLLAIGAAAEHVARQLDVIGVGIVAAQAELEAVLAARGAVAGAGVAAADVEGGDHLVAEADGRRLVEVFDFDRDCSPFDRRP